MAATATTAPATRSARERLLDAADELFYAEGVHVVGIDRVIERAGVAKATLYSVFGSKDGLVKAYLERRHEQRKAAVLFAIEQHRDPRERLLAVFDALEEIFARPTFRGCAFANATAEVSATTVATEMGEVVRSWTRNLLIELSREAGATDPEALGRQLVLLYDGSMTGARLDHDPQVAQRARTLAGLLLDAATAG